MISVCCAGRWENDFFAIVSRTSLKQIQWADHIIAPILGVYDNSPNQWHHPSVSFPLKGNKYFEIYKNYFIKKIKENKIRTVYETREDDFTILELVLNPNCFFNKKDRVSAMLIKMRLNEDCKDFRWFF